MKTKKCSRKTCIVQNPQPIENFHKNRYREDGLSTACKDCRLKEANDYYDRNREERLAYAKGAYVKDPAKFSVRNKKYSDEDPERKTRNNKKSHIKWYSVEENRKSKYEYYRDHKEEKREYDRTYRPNREKIDLNYKICNRLRSRMNMAINKKAKSGSAVRDLGCSIDQFVTYIESFWEPGMNWKNYGRGYNKWSFDHTIPLSSFDLTNREQFLKACHYSNIKPMWHLDNMRKHAKTPK